MRESFLIEYRNSVSDSDIQILMQHGAENITKSPYINIIYADIEPSKVDSIRNLPTVLEIHEDKKIRVL